MILRPMAALATILALAFATSAAAEDDSALNKEGFWTVGRGDAGAKGCMASLTARDDTMLLIQVAPGHVDFVVGKPKPMRRGKKGVIAIGEQTFDFAPDYTDRGDLLFFEDVNGRGLAAIRSAASVVVRVDGRKILDMGIEDTGVEGALDATVACSEGKSGWWGPGVGAERISEGPVPNKLTDAVVYSENGRWGVAAGPEPGVCVAQGKVDQQRHLQILAAFGQLGLAVGTDGVDLPRGSKGRVETDAYTFDFNPEYGADSYMAADKPFDPKAIEALGRAKWVRVSVDGKPLVDAALEGSGFADVLRSVAACSHSEAGWWGPGAKRP